MKMPSSFLLLFSILPSLTHASFSTTISNDDPDFLDLLEQRGFDEKASPFVRTSQTPGSPTPNPQNQPTLAEEKNANWDVSSDSEEGFNVINLPTFSYDWNSPKTKKRAKKKQGTMKKMMMSKSSTKNNHRKPSSSPSVKPSTARSPEPTKKPSSSPSAKPSTTKSTETAKPSSSPSPKPSKSPETAKPSSSPSVEPPTTQSPEPTNPSSPPSAEPSATWSPEPTPMATEDAALMKTDPPSLSPVIPSSVPTVPPTVTPTASPTGAPVPQVCACSPVLYDLQFDFSLDCDDTSIDYGNGGIGGADCSVTPLENTDITDLVPVLVNDIRILELGQNLRVMAVTDEVADYVDGSTFSFDPVSKSGQEALRGVQFIAIGENAAGASLLLQAVVLFTNDCGVFPVLNDGDSLGWVVFAFSIAPPASICPAV